MKKETSKYRALLRECSHSQTQHTELITADTWAEIRKLFKRNVRYYHADIYRKDVTGQWIHLCSVSKREPKAPTREAAAPQFDTIKWTRQDE
jgi:hypothetical protein